MRLAIAGVLRQSLEAIGPEQIAQVRALGFHAAALNIRPVDELPGRATVERFRRECSTQKVDIVELGQYATNFVHPSSAERETSLRRVRNAVRLAADLGCPTVIVGAGSLNTAGLWFPHPDNFTVAAFDRLVSSLGTLAPAAEEAGVRIALECHVATTPRNPETARDILDAVGSTSVVANLDPVNWMTLETAYTSAAAVTDMITTLGVDRIAGIHNKGLRVEDQLITHLSETHTAADDDVFDHSGVLAALHAIDVNWNVVVEHIALDLVPDARDFLLKQAEEVGANLTIAAHG